MNFVNRCSVVSGSNGAPTSLKSGERRERYLVIGDSHVVREHPTRNINIEVSL